MMQSYVERPEEKLPRVSVVLPVLNGAGRLEHALEALCRQDYPRHLLEIIVADGRSRDATADIAKAFGCRVVDNPGVTVAAGRNVGVRHATGELIAFSEDDIVLPPHWVRTAVNSLRTSGATGVGGPTPIPQSSRPWSHAVNAVFRAASRRGQSVQSDQARSGVVEDLPGGNSMYTAAGLRAVAPIDESLVTAEDVAMHHAMRRRGWELRLCGELAAEHHKRDTVSGFFNQMRRFAIGRVQLSRRWRGALAPIHRMVGAAPPLLLTLAIAGFASGPPHAVMLVLLGALAALCAVLVALRQGERPAVALLFPAALAVFLAGWTAGFWSETVLPTEKPTRTGFAQKVSDALSTTRLEASTWLRRALLAGLALQSLALAVFSQRAPFIMDEFQQGGYARHIDAGYYSVIVPFKTVLFTYLYYLPRLWLEDARSILLFQRGQTAALVFATLWGLYAISRRLGRTEFEALLVCLATISVSTFFEHGISLRAEPAALLLATLALYVAVGSPGVHGRWRAAATGGLLGASFFCTQKASWFCISVGLGALASTWVAARSDGASAPRAGSCRRALAITAAGLVAGFSGVATAYCFAFPGASPLEVFRGVFARSTRYALQKHDVYGDLSTFITQSMERNAWFYAACAAGLAAAGARVTKDSRLSCCWVTTATMSVFIATWKEPWPYVLTWWIPFLALFVPDMLRLAKRIMSRGGAARWGAAGAAVCVLLPVLFCAPRRLEVLAWSNQHQLAFVDRVESLLRPGERYQDGIGMVSTRDLSGLVWWDARAIARILQSARAGDHSELEAAFKDAPKVLVVNYRIINLWAAARSFVEGSYVPVDGGLMVAGVALPAGDAARFEARWEGQHTVVDAEGRAVAHPWSLDGRAITGSAQVLRGPHEVGAENCDQCFLVPGDVAGKVKPATQLTFAQLFDRPYTR